MFFGTFPVEIWSGRYVGEKESRQIDVGCKKKEKSYRHKVYNFLSCLLQLRIFATLSGDIVFMKRVD